MGCSPSTYEYEGHVSIIILPYSVYTYFAYCLILLMHSAHPGFSTFTSASLRSLVSGTAGFPTVVGVIAAIV